MRRLRFVLSIIVLCTAFLPLSRCANMDVEKEAAVLRDDSWRQTLFPVDQPDISYHYGFEFFGFHPVAGTKEPRSWADVGLGLLFLLVFLWPLLVCVLGEKITPPRFRRILYLLELLLCAGSLYGLWIIADLGEWLYGAYVSIASVLALALATVVNFFCDSRRRPG